MVDGSKSECGGGLGALSGRVGCGLMGDEEDVALKIAPDDRGLGTATKWSGPPKLRDEDRPVSSFPIKFGLVCPPPNSTPFKS